MTTVKIKEVRVTAEGTDPKTDRRTYSGHVLFTLAGSVEGPTHQHHGSNRDQYGYDHDRPLLRDKRFTALFSAAFLRWHRSWPEKRLMLYSDSMPFLFKASP